MEFRLFQHLYIEPGKGQNKWPFEESVKCFSEIVTNTK